MLLLSFSGLMAKRSAGMFGRKTHETKLATSIFMCIEMVCFEKARRYHNSLDWETACGKPARNTQLLSARMLGELAGTSHATVAYIERGRSQTPRADVLLGLAWCWGFGSNGWRWVWGIHHCQEPFVKQSKRLFGHSVSATLNLWGVCRIPKLAELL